MKTDKLKEELANSINTLLGEVKPTDLKQWVKNKQPTEEGYYIVLAVDSNPKFIHTCRPAVHFWCMALYRLTPRKSWRI